MLISGPRPDEGICFAWLPKWTPDGRVWLEWVHYKRIHNWGWGSSDTYEYARWVSEEFYADGERRKFKRDIAACHSEEPGLCTYPDCPCTRP